MDDQYCRNLCLDLIHAESEMQVIEHLSKAGYWKRDEVWRNFGDIENNFSTIGNQASRPEAALIEKLVNSVDARLTGRCLEDGIDPESTNAPQTIRDAVARFFGPNGPSNGRAGFVREWSDFHRREVARGITLAATGAKPGAGNPCFTISDCGEGQLPREFPNTILSLHRSNKLRIPFVQGKFNMGGTGSLRFCGEHNLQLVVSRRNPKLLDNRDQNDQNWGFTIVRRRDKGNSKNTVYEYLAPMDAEQNPQHGGILHFYAPEMPIFPEGRRPYHRPSKWGTLIKLYEYQLKKKSHILRKDGLLHRLDLLLAEIALPIRLHECRDGYRGHEGSFDNNLTGFRVRLEDNRADNLEFDPSSSPLKVLGESMTATIYAFKKGRAETYRNDEGIIFTVNGQTHGHLTTDFFRRKKVGLSYLRDSILVVVDCSEINARAREDLFMNSRDRLADCDLRNQIEEDLENILKNHPGLRELRERRRREEVEAKVAGDKPLEEVLRSLLSKSPNLFSLFMEGERLSNPFRPKHVGSNDQQFQGKKYPTYFRFKGKKYGANFDRTCHINERCRIAFETDAENEYFSRDLERGEFSLVLESNGGTKDVDDYALNLQNGIANLTLRLPTNCTEGDQLRFIATTDDPTLVQPFVNQFQIKIMGEAKPHGGSKKRRKPPGPQNGKERELPSGLSLPKVREVTEKEWKEYNFDAYTALEIKHVGEEDSPDVYDFYINVDNIHLKNFLKLETGVDGDGAKLVKAQFKYGLVLLGLAIIKQDAMQKENGSGNVILNKSLEANDVEKSVKIFSRAAAAVLLPVIRSLGELDIGDDEDGF